MRSFSFLALFVAIAAASCSYRTMRVKAGDGKHYLVRYYPDPEKRRAYNERCIFKYSYKPGEPMVYGKPSVSDTVHGMTFFQFDSARVYLTGDADMLKLVFASGLLSAKTIYCAADSSCRPFSDGVFYMNGKGKMQLPSFHGWQGYYMYIDLCRQLDIKGTPPTHRRFTFRIMGTGGFTLWFFELVNENAGKNTSWETFVKGAKLTFLQPGWSEI